MSADKYLIGHLGEVQSRDFSNDIAWNDHNSWLCTLRQLVRRYGMDIGEIVFGSRYRLDRFMPLPRGIKHTSFHAEIYLEPPK